jgi:hypothetical protein
VRTVLLVQVPGGAAVGAGVRGVHELGLGCDGMWLGQGRWIWWASVVVEGSLAGLEVGLGVGGQEEQHSQAIQSQWVVQVGVDVGWGYLGRWKLRLEEQWWG